MRSLKACKKCRIRKKNVSPAQIEARRKYSRNKYHEDPEYRAKAVARMTRSKKANPEKLAAWKAVYYAVKKGNLKRLPCQTCGAEKSQAHHPDYSKKLEVIWMCASCHMRSHATEDPS